MMDFYRDELISNDDVNINSKLFLENNDCFNIGNYYVNKKKIGMGSFATIYHGVEKNLGREVAIKRIHVKDIQKLTPNITKEIEIMKELKHPNIVRLYDVIYETDFDNVNIIMEYAPLGNLADFYKKNGAINEVYCKYYMRQLAKGLKYLLVKSIMHRDLKPHNILMFENNIIKIADFGFARNFTEDQLFNTLCGSPLYMAPEIVIPLSNKMCNKNSPKLPRQNKNQQNKPHNYNTKADLWSIGVILFEIITGSFPINAKSLYHLPQIIKEMEIKIPINIIMSYECRDLINRLLIKNPIERIEWTEFFNHRWFLIDEMFNIEKNNIQKENNLMEMADKFLFNSNSNSNNLNNSPYTYTSYDFNNNLNNSPKIKSNHSTPNSNHSSNSVFSNSSNSNSPSPRNGFNLNLTNNLNNNIPFKQSSPKLINNNNHNNPNNPNNKLSKLNFELSTTKYNNFNSNSNNSNNYNSYDNKSELTILHNSFQELKKNYLDKDNKDNKDNNNKDNKKYSVLSYSSSLSLNNENLNLNLEIEEIQETQEDLFMSCEEIEEKLKNNDDDNNDNKDDTDKKNEIESKLDLIIGQLQELKNNKTSTLNFKKEKTYITETNKTTEINKTTETTDSTYLKDSFDLELSFNKIMDSNSSNEGNYLMVDSPLSFEENKKNNYILLTSNPININKNINNINNINNGKIVPNSLKTYINTSINILKESANYLTGNYKSI